VTGHRALRRARHVGTVVVVALVGLAVGACQRAPLPTSREGRALYAENGCASCHGATGRGDGPVSATLDPRPRDFRDAAAFKKGFDVTAIAATVANGLLVDVPVSDGRGGNSHHRQGMPKFEHLSDVERQSLALYVIALRGEAR